MLAIYKRELSSYFHSPVGWVVVAVSTFLSGFFFAFFAAQGYISIEEELSFLQGLFIYILPLITMRLFSEERKNGTEILLYTSPVSLFKVVLGKYFAAMTLFFVMISGTLIHVFLTAFWGGRVGATTIGAYLAFALIASIFIGIGLFTSAITENQIVAAIISLGITVVIQMLLPVLATVIQNGVSTLISSLNVFRLPVTTISNIALAFYNGINWMNPFSRMSNMYQGVFDVSPLVYCFSLAAFFLFLTYRVLEKKRWSKG